MSKRSKKARKGLNTARVERDLARLGEVLQDGYRGPWDTIPGYPRAVVSRERRQRPLADTIRPPLPQAPRQKRLFGQRALTREALALSKGAPLSRAVRKKLQEEGFVSQELRETICRERKQRRQVLFATKRTGKGAAAPRRQRSIWSDVKC